MISLRHPAVPSLAALCLLCLTTSGRQPAAAQSLDAPAVADSVTPWKAPTGRAVLGGAIGSAVGLSVGLGIGLAIDHANDDCSETAHGYEGKSCVAVLTVLLGDIVGTALGVRLLPDWKGHEPPLGKTLLVASLGSLGGAVAGGLTKALTGQRPVMFLSFTVSQGAITGGWAAHRGR